MTKKLLITTLLATCLVAGCGNAETTAKAVSQETNMNLKFNSNSRNKKKVPKKIRLVDGKKGKYGKYDLFDGEPYLRFYIPKGTYKVKCKHWGGFYIEGIKLYKENGWDTSDIIRQVDIATGEKVKIKVKKGQCISLYVNTELVLTKK